MFCLPSRGLDPRLHPPNDEAAQNRPDYGNCSYKHAPSLTALPDRTPFRDRSLCASHVDGGGKRLCTVAYLCLKRLSPGSGLQDMHYAACRVPLQSRLNQFYWVSEARSMVRGSLVREQLQLFDPELFPEGVSPPVVESRPNAGATLIALAAAAGVRYAPTLSEVRRFADRMLAA